MNLIENLNWRYATKRMNGTKVPAEKIDTIVEAIRLTPSSAGMQPYKVFVIDNEDLKKKLQSASFNPQVSESSHLLVFAAYEKITESQIDAYMTLVAEVRSVAEESLSVFRKKLKDVLLSMSPTDSLNWATRQAYIALGTAVIAAAELKVDATPMEGFEPAAFDETLGLKEKGLRSVVLLALGYRDETNDFLANAKKVRVPKELFAFELS